MCIRYRLWAILRKHSSSDHRNNFFSGGTAQPATITKQDKHIISILKPKLQELNLQFVGIDIIGDYLIEVNVTSPTCLQELNKLSNKSYHIEIMNKVLQRDLIINSLIDYSSDNIKFISHDFGAKPLDEYRKKTFTPFWNNFNTKPKKSPATNVKKIKDLTSMNVTDLKNMAKENGIANISKMKKADLIKALS